MTQIVKIKEHYIDIGGIMYISPIEDGSYHNSIFKIHFKNGKELIISFNDNIRGYYTKIKTLHAGLVSAWAGDLFINIDKYDNIMQNTTN